MTPYLARTQERKGGKERVSVPAPSQAGAVTGCRGGKGGRRVKLRTLKDGHKKWEISCLSRILECTQN